MENDTITGVGGIRVGHAELDGVSSGCTVILPDGGCAAGVDIRGGAPGTYGTDLLSPVNMVDRIHGLFLSGGSAFGLSTADGVRKYLAEHGLGFDTGHGVVPIVSGAILFDLDSNRSGTYPGAELAYQASRKASSLPVEEGSTGAGAGATVGKLFGPERCMKGGIGSSCIQGAGGLKVGAIMAVNALGEIVDPATGIKVAGARKSPQSLELADSVSQILKVTSLQGFPAGDATIIGAVATNAALNKTQLTRVAQMAHDGMARAVYPVHTQHDGDTIFALSCGDLEFSDLSLIGALAAMATTEAILRAVRKAHSAAGIPAAGSV